MSAGDGRVATGDASHDAGKDAGADGGSGDGGGSSGGDAGDAGDANVGTDAGPCGKTCGGNAPACDVASSHCVQCTAAEHAACKGTTPVCDTSGHACVQCTAAEHAACTGATPVCDGAASMCVGCVSDDDCTDPGASVCDLGTQTCKACAGDSDCTHLTATPKCFEPTGRCAPACASSAECTVAGATACDMTQGLCAKCSVTDETACTGNSCDPAMDACTTTPKASVNACGACRADSECVKDYRCIPLMFNGAMHGDYCMKRLSVGCTEPYATSVTRDSVSGATSEAYCGINEAKTSCEAVLGLATNQKCPGGSDAECGSLGALCRTVSGLDKRCTYRS